jgi:hypothetical protein
MLLDAEHAVARSGTISTCDLGFCSAERESPAPVGTAWFCMTRKGSEVRVLYGPPEKALWQKAIGGSTKRPPNCWDLNWDLKPF